MNKQGLNRILRRILNFLVVWTYTFMAFYLAFSQRPPNYSFIVFMTGVGLGYFIGKINPPSRPA
jgi:hypothetical protein